MSYNPGLTNTQLRSAPVEVEDARTGATAETLTRIAALLYVQTELLNKILLALEGRRSGETVVQLLNDAQTECMFPFDRSF